MHEYDVIFYDEDNNEITRRRLTACDDWDICLRAFKAMEDIHGATDFQVVWV